MSNFAPNSDILPGSAAGVQQGRVAQRGDLPRKMSDFAMNSDIVEWNHARRQEAQMYEYRVIRKSTVNPSVLQTELNGLAQQGFRLVGVAGGSPSGAVSLEAVCIMERVVPEPAPTATMRDR